MTKQQVNFNCKKIKILMSYIELLRRRYFSVFYGSNHANYFFDHAVRIEYDSFLNCLIFFIFLFIIVVYASWIIALVGVELQTLVSEPDALTTRQTHFSNSCHHFTLSLSND